MSDIFTSINVFYSLVVNNQVKKKVTMNAKLLTW